jgi:hypothetical protein
MTTIQDIIALVKNIAKLSNALPPSVPKGTTKDKIWAVMHTAERDSGFETFNARFDVLFGEDCCDDTGRLHYIRQGKSGLGLICLYLKKIDWTQGFLLDLVEIKLKHLNAELSYIMYVLQSLLPSLHTNTYQRIQRQQA